MNEQDEHGAVEQARAVVSKLRVAVLGRDYDAVALDDKTGTFILLFLDPKDTEIINRLLKAPAPAGTPDPSALTPDPAEDPATGP